jgi:hypothetical protein
MWLYVFEAFPIRMPVTFFVVEAEFQHNISAGFSSFLLHKVCRKANRLFWAAG